METQTLDFVREVSDVIANYALEVAGAVVLFVVGWIVAGWSQRRTRSGLARIERIDPTLTPLIANLVRYAILLLVVVAVLAQFGVQTTSVIAVLGAAGIAVALALQGTLSNIASGIMLLFLQPMKVGEYVDADGIAGTVNEIGLFTIQMTTYDGIYMSVPNSQIWNRAIRNYSRLPTRRLDLVVGIAYGDDIGTALAVLTNLLEGDERVRAEPAPQVMVTELADSAVNINLRCWTESGNYWGLRFDLARGAKECLDREGVTIPFPQRDVHIVSERSAGEAASVA